MTLYIRKGYLLKRYADEQVLFTLVGEGVSSDLLPWAILQMSLG